MRFVDYVILVSMLGGFLGFMASGILAMLGGPAWPVFASWGFVILGFALRYIVDGPPKDDGGGPMWWGPM